MKMVFHNYPITQAEDDCARALEQLGFEITENNTERIKAIRLDDSPLGALLMDVVFQRDGEDAKVKVYSGVMDTGGVIGPDPFLERMLYTRLSFDVTNLSLEGGTVNDLFIIG